jgi:hypothetical protein
MTKCFDDRADNDRDQHGGEPHGVNLIARGHSDRLFDPDQYLAPVFIVIEGAVKEACDVHLPC